MGQSTYIFLAVPLEISDLPRPSLSMSRIKKREQKKHSTCVLLCYLLISHCHAALRLPFAVAAIFTLCAQQDALVQPLSARRKNTSVKGTGNGTPSQ